MSSDGLEGIAPPTHLRRRAYRHVRPTSASMSPRVV